MAVALDETDAELLVFLDADVENFDPHFVTGLLGPLLSTPARTTRRGAGEGLLRAARCTARAAGGGRVTELVARPVIDLLFPHLAGVRQPLAGETAAPRTVLDKTGLAPGYGVELALLIDVARALRRRADRPRSTWGCASTATGPCTELRPQATDVLGAALRRAGVTGARPIRTSLTGAAHRRGARSTARCGYGTRSRARERRALTPIRARAPGGRAARAGASGSDADDGRFACADGRRATRAPTRRPRPRPTRPGRAPAT